MRPPGRRHADASRNYLRTERTALIGRNQLGTEEEGAGMNQEQQNIIIYNTADGKASVKLLARDGMVWMSQGQLAELFDTSKQNIGQHVANILNERELDKNSVVKNYFTTAADGKKYQVVHYSLEMILAVGFRVRSKRGTQFRIWANDNLKEYIVKGFISNVIISVLNYLPRFDQRLATFSSWFCFPCSFRFTD